MGCSLYGVLMPRPGAAQAIHKWVWAREQCCVRSGHENIVFLTFIPWSRPDMHEVPNGRKSSIHIKIRPLVFLLARVGKVKLRNP